MSLFYWSEEQMKKIYELKDVNAIYGKGVSAVHALKDINLDIYEKDSIAIVGQSGAGKSTLLNVLCGLEHISSGRIIYEEKELSKLNNNKLSDLRLNEFGFVFQQFYLISSLSVYDNICLPSVANQGKVDREWLHELVELLGLSKRLYHVPNQLSGGEKQRVAIGRALINKPKVIFADEPSGNLDSVRGEQVFDMLFSCIEKYGQTLIYVTHDMEKAKLAKRKIILKDGVIN